MTEATGSLSSERKPDSISLLSIVVVVAVAAVVVSIVEAVVVFTLTQCAHSASLSPDVLSTK